MSAFRVLRARACLTVAEASRLLGVASAKIAAYEAGDIVPSAREMQVLRGLAILERGKDYNASCGSTATKATCIDRTKSTRTARRRGLSKLILETSVPISQTLSSDAVADQVSVPLILQEMRHANGMSAAEISQLLGASLVSVVRWERGDNQPGPDMAAKILALHRELKAGNRPTVERARKSHTFASRGARTDLGRLPLFRHRLQVALSDVQQKPLIRRLQPSSYWGAGESVLASLFDEFSRPSRTIDQPATSGVSAGKNTYTYDAHTYHTKVPPQGIAEILTQYLPEGGLILDPFGGSGMTGVAARAVGYDVILNELSPAASFIADRFTRVIDPNLFSAGVRAVCEALQPIRRDLYQTECRECRKGAVAGLVGIEVGVVSGVFNLESPGVEAPGWRPRHEERYHASADSAA